MRDSIHGKIYDLEFPLPRRGCYESDNGDLIHYYGRYGVVTMKEERKGPYEMIGYWRKIPVKEYRKLLYASPNKNDRGLDYDNY